MNYIVLACALLVASFVLYDLALSVDTLQQPLVRTHLTHQAGRVVAMQQQLLQDCADLKTDRALVALAASALAGSTRADRADLAINLTGAEVALTTLEQNYDAARANPDTTVDLTVALPLTHQGCE